MPDDGHPTAELRVYTSKAGLPERLLDHWDDDADGDGLDHCLIEWRAYATTSILTLVEHLVLSATAAGPREECAHGRSVWRCRRTCLGCGAPMAPTDTDFDVGCPACGEERR